jgi:exodeoxyribonuclease VII small subunit
MSNKTLDFAKSYQELQNITADFEKGDFDLEQAIPKFKRAAELAKLLKAHLKNMEAQIEEISISLEEENESPSPKDAVSATDIEF